MDPKLHLCPGSWRDRGATIVQLHGNQERPGLTAATQLQKRRTSVGPNRSTGRGHQGADSLLPSADMGGDGSAALEAIKAPGPLWVGREDTGGGKRRRRNLISTLSLLREQGQADTGAASVFQL